MRNIWQFIKFTLVGVSNTLISEGVYVLLIYFRMHYIAASFIGFSLSVINAYYWNNKYVFNDSDEVKNDWWKVFVRTYIAYFWGYLVNAALLVFWIDFIDVAKFMFPLGDWFVQRGMEGLDSQFWGNLTAAVLNLIITVPMNFVINKYWAFKKHKNDFTCVKLIAAGLVLISLLINIKNIFTSCQVDAEYQVAMAYRIVRGDAMFSEMWEAHQTSAFFLALFEWIYIKIAGTTTGIMVYANAVGILCKTVVALVLFRTLDRYVDKRAAFAAFLLALNIYPKDVVLPDFANLQIWFAILLMCCLINYIERLKAGKAGTGWLVSAAVFLCLEVLSYPSCALVWLTCVIALWKYSSKRKRDIGIFTGICATAGAVYLLVFMRGDPKRFIEYIFYIWSGDESHAVGIAERLRMFVQDMTRFSGMCMGYIIFVMLCAVLAAWLYKLLRSKKGENISRTKFFQICFSCFMAVYVAGYLLGLMYENAGTKCYFFVLYIFVEIAAFAGIGKLNEREKRIFVISQLVGWGGFTATLILSDLGLFPTIAYLIPNILGAMIPIGKFRGGKKYSVPIILLCAVMLFRNAVYVNGWMSAPSSFYEDSIMGVTWRAKYGPLKGIVSREGTFVSDVSYGEWQEFVKPGDRVLVISYPALTSTVYLYNDVEICADSVISTPTYSERLFDYWMQNPDKYPDVVVVKYYEGSVMIGEYNEVARWLFEEFKADRVVDGTYWKFFIKETTD